MIRLRDNQAPPRSRSSGPRRATWLAGLAVPGMLCLGTQSAHAQPTYSIDYQSPTISVPDGATGTPITEGDILSTTFAPGAVPDIFISGGIAPPGLGLPAHAAAVGHLPWVAGQVEVDALSFGFDLLIEEAPEFFIPQQWCFSVDEFAFGLQPFPPMPPNLSTEGSAAFPIPPPPGYEASADVFGYFPPGAMPPGLGPLPPFAVGPGNTDILDGDGLGPLGPFSLGLFEPNFPTPGALDNGCDLDALDVDTPTTIDLGPVYFSLDSGFVFDPIEGAGGTGSGPANGGFSGAAVLVTQVAGTPPVQYALPIQLGLDLVIGFDSDDLDALVLRENGDGVFQPPSEPYQWQDGSVDMIFFSVRRGSAVIGSPDSMFGLPIVEGDVLMPPIAGGLSPFPAIWIAAENLGLCTWRPAAPVLCPAGPWGPFSDDLNALDVAQDCDDDGIPDIIAIALGLFADCNNNGVPDTCDIALGTSNDINGNGVPDECELPFLGFSIDYQGPTISIPDGATNTPITEGDVLTSTFVAGGVPDTVISGGSPGLGLPAHAGAVGHPPWSIGPVEVDALSFGLDEVAGSAPGPYPQQWCFAVDEFAFGLQPPPPLPPNLSTEGSVTYPAPPPPGHEASADLFGFFPPGAYPAGIGPAPPFIIPPGNVDFLDGDGLGPIWPYPLQLVEPNFPTAGPPDGGDNLDAFDMDVLAPTPQVFPVYFSLDSGAVFDAVEGTPGTGSAGANGGFSGADVLVTRASISPPVVYAPAAQLGLDLVNGFDSDDLDALILWDNGDGVFQVPAAPYQWETTPVDMIFFSVRRGSAVIGSPDSAFGLPITEGDILMPPIAGGLSPFPAIWIAAENLGLCTWRAGAPPLCPPPPWNLFTDDLNGLDLLVDCNDDGAPDAMEILVGIANDCDFSGIADSCDCGDTDGDCDADIDDIVNVVLDWGTDGSLHGGDVDRNGITDIDDIVLVILTWGVC